MYKDARDYVTVAAVSPVRANLYVDTPLRRLSQLQPWLDALHASAGEQCRSAEDGHY